MDDSSFKIKGLKPLKGRCKPFHQQVRELRRPYIKISDVDYERFMSDSADFYLSRCGKIVYTFGNADGGYALMPLVDEAAQTIMESQ